MEIQTSNNSSVASFIQKLNIPEKNSHKGQNGRILVIGGSSLFHASAIWAAEVASHFVDIVHFASTEENNQILFETKKKYHNGIIISRIKIPEYIQEDDAVLIGPGMIRSEVSPKSEVRSLKFSEILELKDEAELTQEITKCLLEQYPEKRFVLDAGALQMMDPQWLKAMKTPPLITPHQLEFERLFKIKISDKKEEEKIEIVKKIAAEYKTVILLKAVFDIISDGTNVYIIKGGNQGLTKGGTGDILAGLCTALIAKNNAVDSAVIASYLLKKSADRLSSEMGYWYNNENLINEIPKTLHSVISS
jgi:NAD(P)H-hydrate epimerase